MSDSSEAISKLKELRAAASDIFYAALRAVDAREAVRRSVTLEGSTLKLSETLVDISHRATYVVAVGKAAREMAVGLNDVVGERITHGIITGPQRTEGPSPDPNRWDTFFGGHPLPNEQSLQAGRATFELLRKANQEHALVIFLISGGGSAMIEWPRDQRITLDTLREANSLLVSCGASIAEINSVRRMVSAVKGGGLSLCAPDADQVSLIISDTNPGEEANVASGPTLKPSIDSPDPKKVVQRYRLQSSLHPLILCALSEVDTCGPERKQLTDKPHYVLLDNQSAIVAAKQRAQDLGFAVRIDMDIREQPVVEGCTLLLSRLGKFWNGSAKNRPLCLLSGGEFSCPFRGKGIGGRNLETVLRCAMQLDESPTGRQTVVLSVGTDGLDGNSPAAGAIADNTTIARARSLALDARDYLERSDSFTFFDGLGDALITGSTGTNVRDLRIMLTCER